MSLYFPGSEIWSWGGAVMLFMLTNRQEMYAIATLSFLNSDGSIHVGLPKTL